MNQIINFGYESITNKLINLFLDFCIFSPDNLTWSVCNLTWLFYSDFQQPYCAMLDSKALRKFKFVNG